MPNATKNLLRIGLVHSLALQCGFTSIREEGTTIYLSLQQVDFDALSTLAKTYAIKLMPSTKPCLKLQRGLKEKSLPLLSSFLADLHALLFQPKNPS